MYWQQADPCIGSSLWLPVALLILNHDDVEKAEEKEKHFYLLWWNPAGEKWPLSVIVIMVVSLCRVWTSLCCCVDQLSSPLYP